LPHDPACSLRIGGLTALSTTDYPGQLAAVVFCQGCPWRCAYCHNPHLLARRGEQETAWTEFTAFLERRRGLLDAVVFSGGEPTLHLALPAAMCAVKSMGFAVGLHTAGIYPRRLQAVLPFVDWIGMDIKAPFDDYARVTGIGSSGAAARESIQLVMASGIPHEFRTTVHPSLLPAPDLLALAQQLVGLGVHNYVLQEFRDRGCEKPELAGRPSYLTEAFCRVLAGILPAFTLRRV
jgi:pyruvate formate lyase activating enzyme